VVEELDVDGVADALLDDWVLDVALDAELVVELVLLVLVWVLATALPIGLAAMTPTSPGDRRWGDAGRGDREAGTRSSRRSRDTP
jgi:hypothetical protein